MNVRNIGGSSSAMSGVRDGWDGGRRSLGSRIVGVGGETLSYFELFLVFLLRKYPLPKQSNRAMLTPRYLGLSIIKGVDDMATVYSTELRQMEMI